MDTPQLALAVEKVGLTYVSDAQPGISRKPTEDGFTYAWADGEPVRDEHTLDRIRALAIPPAYIDVWICENEFGHLQATGRDARGRKQYRYHPKFRTLRDADKFERMIDFAESLPTIHERMRRDMAKSGLCRRKVLASVVYLLERSLIRVGNEEYAHQNHSYGVTTLLADQVVVNGSRIQFRFMGKSKVFHDISLQDRRLAHVVKSLQDLPGQELFQYVDAKGTVHRISSQDVNDYLRDASGREITAKDFRTWAATSIALGELAQLESFKNEREAKRHLSRVIKYVSSQLRNTPAICRKCYVHPAITDAFLARDLPGRFKGPAQIQDGDELSRVLVDLLRERRAAKLLGLEKIEPLATRLAA